MIGGGEFSLAVCPAALFAGTFERAMMPYPL